MHLQLWFQAVAIIDMVIHHFWLHNQCSTIKMLSAKSYIIRVNYACLKLWSFCNALVGQRNWESLLYREDVTLLHAPAFHFCWCLFSSHCTFKTNIIVTHMGLQMWRYTHTYAQLANDTWIHASVHLMGGSIFLCVIKCRLQLKFSSFLGRCQHHFCGHSGVSWGLLWSLSLITACAHRYTQSDCEGFIAQTNGAKHEPINYFLSPHPAVVTIPWYHPLHITSLLSTTHILHISSFPPCCIKHQP